MKQILVITICVLWSLLSIGQTENAIGLRMGPAYGVTFQHFMSDTRAFELIAHSRWRGFQITGLYEVHAPAFDVKGLQWYYGAGAHIGFYSWYDRGPRWYNDEWEGSRTLIGVDGILGIEYFIGDIPFQISLDWKPSFHLIGYTGWWGDEGAISVRYTF